MGGKKWHLTIRSTPRHVMALGLAVCVIQPVNSNLMHPIHNLTP
jgi:hypothetical protein